MGIYLAYMVSPLIIYIVLTFLYKKPIYEMNKTGCRYLFVCGIVIFLMIACMNYRVGSGDAVWYYNNWAYLSQISRENFSEILKYFDMEKGYLISVWILSHIWKNPQFVFVLYGLLVAISVGRFIRLNCKNPILGIVMFNCLGLWGFMVQGIRQGIAMCICLFAIEYCKQRKLVRFLLIVLLATAFHASAIAFIAVYFLPCIEMNRKGYIVAVSGMIFVSLTINKLFGMINFLINDSYRTGEIERTSGGFVSAAIYILIIVAALYFYGGSKKTNLEIRMFFYMVCCGLFIFMLRYNVNTITQRVAHYYAFSQIPMLTAVIDRLKRRDKILATMIVITLCLGITIYKAGYSELVPYYFFWQG